MTPPPRIVGALALCLSLMTLSPVAMALNPETTPRIESSRFLNLSNIANLRNPEDTTAYMGLDQCQIAARDNSPIRIEFTTTFDIEGTMNSSGLGLDALYVFENNRGSTGRIDCTLAGMCNPLSNENYTVMGRTVTTDTGLTFADLTGIRSAGECNSKDQEYFVRISITEDTRLVNADLRLIVDTVAPGEPDSFTAILTENRASVTWEDAEVADVEDYVVVFSTQPIPAGSTLAGARELPGFAQGTVRRGSTNTGQVSVSLPPGQDVWVGFLARDQARNTSKIITNPDALTVLDTTDFWEQYRRAGGAEDGGHCQSSPRSPSPSPLLLLALLFVPGHRRLRRLVASSFTRHSR